MNNFAKRKAQFLDWFKKGNVIERCSEPGPVFGKFSGTEACPVSGIEPLIARLFRDGVLKYKTFYSYGIRWERYYLPETSGKHTGDVSGGESK